MTLTTGITSRLPNQGTTIFTVMSALAQQHQAINLAQGFPDFQCDPLLVDLAYRHMKEGKNQYAPMPGILPLRKKISEKTYELYGAQYNPDTEVTITCGATEACFVAITAMVSPGDEVIIPEPAFDVYIPAIELCGAKPVFVSMEYPEYSIPWDKVEEKITPKTKLLILNSPHNPTGSVMNANDIQQLKRLLEKYPQLFLLSDEVYEHIIFDGKKHESMCWYPELRERSLIISSFGKTFHTTGWRMGYCIAPEYLSKEFRKVHQYITFCAAAPLQYAVMDYLDYKEKYQQLPEFYQQKRDLFNSLITSSRFELVPSSGTYFQLLSYRNISGENDVTFAERLTKEYKIASIPVSVFHHELRDNKVLRFCFAKENETLSKAAEILCRI